MGCPRTLYGCPMDTSRPMGSPRVHGQRVGYLLATHGVFVECPLVVRELFVDWPWGVLWDIGGSSVRRPWGVREVSVGCQ